MKNITIKSEALALPAIGIGTAEYAENFTKSSSYICFNAKNYP